MPDSVIQCGNCGHETPAESIYCENCGICLKDVVPERPTLMRDSDVQDPMIPEEAPEFLANDLLQAAPAFMQPTAPPPFADVVGLSGGFFEPEYKIESSGAFRPENEGADKSGVADEGGVVDEGKGESKVEDQGGAEAAGGIESENSHARRIESASQNGGSYYSLEGYIGPATLETQLPPIPSFQLNDDEYPPVDPQSAPYQPKLGAFRITVVAVMAVLFGIALVLLFCLVVMRLLGF